MATAEFSQFGSLKDLIEGLVESDMHAKEFFESLYDGGEVEVCYESKLSEAINKLKEATKSTKSDKLIVVTTIELFDTENHILSGSRHSIFFVYSNNTIYLYDPNGVYNKSKTFAYNHENKFYPNTNAFKNFLKTQFPDKKIIVPTKIGIQQSIETPDNTGWINEGGYCMFYNSDMIREILGNPDRLAELMSLTYRKKKKLRGRAQELFYKNKTDDAERLKKALDKSNDAKILEKAVKMVKI